MYIYKAECLRVVDGDTADVLIDLGFDTWRKSRLRFKGVDTWEKRTRNKDSNVRRSNTIRRRILQDGARRRTRELWYLLTD